MEKQIQSKIKKKLQADGWLVIKLIKTSHNGIPDLLCCKDGKVMFVEVKQEKGTLTKLQQERISELREKGFECKIWTDYETDFKSR
jgi:Holliday junction resolvase